MLIIESKIVDKSVEHYLRELLPQNTGKLKEMEDYADEYHVPIVHPEVAQFLKVMIKMNKTMSILEIGTAIGYSATVFGNAMEEGGKITTIELKDDMYDLAKENLKPIQDRTDITMIKGDAAEVLESVEGEFDLIFIDAAKGHYEKFFNLCFDKLKNGGIIVSDNVLYKGMIANDDYVVRRKITIVKRMRNYLKFISEHPNLETTILPIADGVAISYKMEEI